MGLEMSFPANGIVIYLSLAGHENRTEKALKAMLLARLHIALASFLHGFKRS